MSEAATEIPVLDRGQAEEKGWVIVHESVSQGLFRAEKPASNGKVEQAGSTMESLLLAISYYENHLDSIESPPQPELQAIADEAEPEEALRTVTAPDGEAYTEAEWAARDSGYAATAEAAAEGQEAKKDAEDEKKAGEEVESETLETVNSSNQPDNLMSVYPGEESLNDVIERKQAESQASEEARGAANQGIGPNGPEGVEGLMGGPPETYDPGPGLSVTEQAMLDEHVGTAEAAQAERDEAEAQAAEAATQSPEQAAEAPAATPAAEAKAQELGVDLAAVEGTGADGKITVGDVENAAKEE